MFELFIIIAFLAAIGSVISYERWLYQDTQREFKDTGWCPDNSKGD